MRTPAMRQPIRRLSLACAAALLVGCATWAVAGGPDQVTDVLRQLGLTGLRGATDGQVATWSASQGRWIPAAAAGGSTPTLAEVLEEGSATGGTNVSVGVNDSVAFAGAGELFNGGVGETIRLEGIDTDVSISSQGGGISLVADLGEGTPTGDAGEIALQANGATIVVDGSIRLTPNEDSVYIDDQLECASDIELAGDIVSTGGGFFAPGVEINSAQQTLSALSGASVATTNLVPAGGRIFAVTVEVATQVTGASSFDVGDGVDDDRYAAAVGLTVGFATNHASATADPMSWSAAAQDVTLTANGSSFTGGAVIVRAFWVGGSPSD